jgi:hypothetical protein
MEGASNRAAAAALAAEAQRGASTSHTHGGTSSEGGGSGSETGGNVSPRHAYLQQQLLQARARLRLRQGSVLGRRTAAVPGLRGPGALQRQQQQGRGKGKGGKRWRGVVYSKRRRLYVATVFVSDPASAEALGASEVVFE